MGGILWGGVAAVAGLYAVFLSVGWLAARRVKHGTASELMVAGRNLPFHLGDELVRFDLDAEMTDITMRARDVPPGTEPGVYHGVAVAEGLVDFSIPVTVHVAEL